jgi:hypothetical protein
MTQAYNLSQLANRVNSSGLLDASTSLINSVPVANGGTSSSTPTNAKIALQVITASTGSAVLPAGTTLQQDLSPQPGYIRFNTDNLQFEGYNGTTWTSVGGGATGGGGDQVFVENGVTITTTYSFPSGKNASSVGPISVNSGVVITIPSNQRWVIL